MVEGQENYGWLMVEEGETKNRQEKQKSTSIDKKNLWRVIWGVCYLFCRIGFCRRFMETNSNGEKQ